MSSPHTSPPLPSGEQELLRLTFCSIVIASFFAALIAGPTLKDFLSPTGSNIATTVLALSAAFAFAYLLSVAASLKFQNPRRVDRFVLNETVAHYFYDLSINVFGIYILVLLVEWLDAHFLHLSGTVWLWPLYIVLFSVTYFVARLAWAGLLRGIEWHYGWMNERRDETGRSQRR